MARGAWVLCDRFTDATYAYQGGGRGVDRQHRIAALVRIVHPRPAPDLTLLLDAPVAGIGRARQQRRAAPIASRPRAPTFFERVRADLPARAARTGAVPRRRCDRRARVVEAAVARLCEPCCRPGAVAVAADADDEVARRQ